MQEIPHTLLPFATITDPRREHPTTKHKLFDVLAIAICAALCGAQYATDYVDWAHTKREWLDSWLELPHGIPAHDTFSRILDLLDPKAFAQAFHDFHVALSGVLQGHIALDGKVLRGSRSHDQAPVHILNAYATHNRLVLAQYALEEGENEIVGLPKLLEMMTLEGCTVSIDAIGCQTEIAQQIVDKGADYMLRVKDNQETLHKDIQDLFALLDDENRPQDQPMSSVSASSVEKGHDRLEERECVGMDLAQFGSMVPESMGRWAGLVSVWRVRRYTQVMSTGEELEVKDKYYISSRSADAPGDAREHLEVSRGHWGIENQVHWVLDVVLREDENGTRSRNGAANQSLIRKMALNAVRREESEKKRSLRRKMNLAGWDHDYFLKLVSLLALPQDV